MKFWINKNSSVDNVVVLAKSGILIASCAEAACDDIQKQFEANAHPLKVFARDDVTVLKFTQLKKIVSRSTDLDVEIRYRDEKDDEEKSLHFQTTSQRDVFLKILGKILPGNFKKSEYQQSTLGAILPSLMSIAAALAIGYFYFNKWRWATIIVGGIWLLLSAFMLITRFRKPPVITRWSEDGRILNKAAGVIKVGFSYAVAAIVAIGFSERLPTTYGEKAIADQMANYELNAADVPTLVEHGADPNYADSYGDRPLHYAIYQTDLDLTVALLSRGADPRLKNGDDYTALEYALRYGSESIIEALVRNANNFADHKNLFETIAQSSPSQKVMEDLINHGFELHAIDPNGKNLLQWAIENYSDYEFIAYLLEKELDANFSIEEQSAVEYLRDQDRLDVIRLLEGNQPNLSSERLAEIESTLDQLIVDIMSQDYDKVLNSLDPKLKVAARLLMAAEDESLEIDPEEHRETVFEQAMIVKSNTKIYDVYKTQCAAIGFAGSASLNDEIQRRVLQLEKYFKVADLLLERDQMIWFKDEQRLPSNIDQAAQVKAKKLEAQFVDAGSDGLEQCQSRLSQFQQRALPDVAQTP